MSICDMCVILRVYLSLFVFVCVCVCLCVCLCMFSSVDVRLSVNCCMRVNAWTFVHVFENGCANVCIHGRV